jgi:hypothetical protein
VRSHPPDEEDATPVTRETVVHNQHLHRENNKACRMVTITKQSCQPHAQIVAQEVRSGSPQLH